MTVLNMIELTEASFDFVYWTIVLFAMGAIFLISGLYSVIKHEDGALIVVIIGMVCLLIAIILTKCSDADIFQVPNGKFHIEATFSEDMPFLSVMENYNILEQRGDIFLLEPKASPIE